MKVRLAISRTFQAEQFEPVNIQAEAILEDVDDYQDTFDKLFEEITVSLTEAEKDLRDIYCPQTKSKRKLKRN